jgi:hypothetical protein
MKSKFYFIVFFLIFSTLKSFGQEAKVEVEKNAKATTIEMGIYSTSLGNIEGSVTIEKTNPNPNTNYFPEVSTVVYNGYIQREYDNRAVDNARSATNSANSDLNRLSNGGRAVPNRLKSLNSRTKEEKRAHEDFVKKEMSNDVRYTRTEIIVKGPIDIGKLKLLSLEQKKEKYTSTYNKLKDRQNEMKRIEHNLSELDKYIVENYYPDITPNPQKKGEIPPKIIDEINELNDKKNNIEQEIADGMKLLEAIKKECPDCAQIEE